MYIKKNSRKINIIINLCLISYLIITTMLDLREIVKTEGDGFLDVIGQSNYFYVAFSWILMFFLMCISNIKNWIIVGIFISIKLGIKNSKRGAWIWQDADFHKYKGYYRDILKQYSPLVLSYVDDFKLDNKDVIATLLNAKLKNNENLTETEEYVIQNRDNIDFNYLKKIVSKEAYDKTLLKNTEGNYKSNKSKKEVVIYVIKLIVFIFILFFMFSLVRFLPTNSLLLDGLIIISGMIGIYLLCYIAYMLLSIIPLVFFGIIGLVTTLFANALKVNIIRTRKGNEINEKLEGLKNYIKHYSMLSDREAKELELWEEYLIYSVMFGINKKIVDNFDEKLF